MRNINVQNSIKNQRFLPMHPDWWKEHKDDLEEGLKNSVEKWEKMLDRIEKYDNKTIHVISLIEDLKQYIDICTD